MRLEETGRFDEHGHENPGAWPEPPAHHGEIDHARVITSSGEGVTGGISTGSADRKQPDLWARQHGTANNLGIGALDVEEED